jgi:serine/threonine protein kinase
MSAEPQGIGRGTLINGRYDVRERLGQGGMGTVWRALDRKLNKMVALKTLLVSDSASEKSREERRRRFMHEIYAINEVEHRNIIQIQEFGFFKDSPYMVMELLKGKDLSRVLKESSEPLTVEYCVDLMLVVIAAIQACHDKGIIHRDLKPGNIMVIEADSGPGWDVKVVDFSISKVASDLTHSGQIVGTPNYLSPEQVNGKAEPASDQYALGLLLYVCLTGRPPFEGLEGLPLIRAIERGEVKKPRSLRSDIPEELEQVILKAMHLDAGQRYPSVHQFGRMIWPFGSPLGKGVWKKYYETPLAPRPAGDAKKSTTGIPLALQMAQGKISISDATALAHYQSTTAVKIGNTTVDDPAARAAAEADPGAPAASVTGGHTPDDPWARKPGLLGTGVPSGWQWQESTGGRKADVSASAEPRPASRLRPAILVLSALAVVLIGVTIARTRAGHRAPAPAEAAKPAQITTPASAVAPPPKQPSSPPPVPAAVEPTAAAATAPEIKSSDGDEARAQRAKRREERARRKQARTEDWGVDPFGNPIPPP